MRNIFMMRNIFQFGCCGVRWYKDWDVANHSVPDSCCRVDVVGCGRNILDLNLEQVGNIQSILLHYPTLFIASFYGV